MLDWLLDSDPSVRWQVMRDLTDAPADAVAAERARVATEGAGARLLALQSPDGRWGCVLEALLEYERFANDAPEVAIARLRGEEYLLERHLFRRKSTGEAIEHDRKGGASWWHFAFPTWWHYDVLRALEHLRRAGAAPDRRAAEAIDRVAAKRDPDGRWPLETRYAGRMPVEMDDGVGRPSRWNTLRALRVLNWWEGAGAARQQGR